jgi:hypothetical protein
VRSSFLFFFSKLTFPHFLSLEFPSICIAKNVGKWWPAMVTGYEPPPPSSPSKKGSKRKNPPKGKFLLTWTTTKTAKLSRVSILFPKDKKFSTATPVRPPSFPLSFDLY